MANSPERLYRVYCEQCRYQREFVMTEAKAEQVVRHRCRVCLAKDPASRALFKVRPVGGTIFSFLGGKPC